MSSQNKALSLPSHKNPLNIDYSKEEHTASSLTKLKYPMLIFANQYSKESKYNTLLKRIMLKTKLILFLNITDLFCTWFFVVKKNNFFIELNPFASNLIHNFPLTIFIKLAVVIAVLLYLTIRAKNSSLKYLKRINLTANLILILYITINFIHLINSIILLFI